MGDDEVVEGGLGALRGDGDEAARDGGRRREGPERRVPLSDALSTPDALALSTVVYQVPTASVGVHSRSVGDGAALRIWIRAPVPGSSARQA